MTSRRLTTILAIAFLLVVAALAISFIPPTRYKAPLVISVQASYPGANAPTVAETVAVPIEEQVNGVLDMLSMTSQSAKGSYTLHVAFKPGTDLDMAQVLVQNRVSLALPVIPALVQREGISVRKQAPEPLMLVSLTSLVIGHDGFPEHDQRMRVTLDAPILQIKDELARLPGVGDVVLFGQRDNRTRVTLDADKLAAHQLSALDVITAISQQNVQIAGGPIVQAPVPKDQQLQLTISTLGRLAESEEFMSIILKATPEDRIVRLKDVARVEPVGNDGRTATLNGDTAVLLAIHPLPNAKPSDVSQAVLDKLAALRARLPKGLALAAAFDFAANLEEPNNPATPEYLVIDAELPETASADRTFITLMRAAANLRLTAGVQDVLALTEHPFSLVRKRPCFVVRLDPENQPELSRARIAENVRVEFQTRIPEAVFRLSVPSTAGGFPVYGFPIEFAIEDHGDHGSANLREGAEALVEKMSRSGKFSDVGVGPGLRHVPFLNLDVDRTRCQALGVETSEIFNTLQVHFGPYYVNNFNELGRTWQVHIQADPRFRDRTSDVLKLQVKNKQNELVRLGTVMDVRDGLGPMVIERHNMYPIARITANLAEGVPLAKARSLCETLAEQEFDTRRFKLVWLAR